MLQEYKTIRTEAQAEIIEKNSRFIATIRPVETEDEARAFIEEIKKKYHDARHNVFAYQIGQRNELQRFSDDGEPQGTAGLPVLNVLKGEDIKNAAIVVTRYFGGTLLGTGGLVRAYGKAAKESLLAAGILERMLFQSIQIKVDYTDSGRVQYETLQGNYFIRDTQYTDIVEFFVYVPIETAETYCKTITETTNGRGTILLLGEVYGSIINGELCEIP